jgi:hypothetical protein
VIADVRADLADAAALAVTDANLAVAEMPVSFRADRAEGWNRALRIARSVHRRVIVKKPVATVNAVATASRAVDQKVKPKKKKKAPPAAPPAKKKPVVKSATVTKPKDTSKSK